MTCVNPSRRQRELRRTTKAGCCRLWRVTAHRVPQQARGKERRKRILRVAPDVIGRRGNAPELSAATIAQLRGLVGVAAR